MLDSVKRHTVTCQIIIHHVVLQNCYILFNRVEEQFSILSRRDHSTSRGIEALYIIVLKSCLLNYAGFIY